MSRHNVLYLLASLAVGAALLLGTVCDWGQLSAAVAALTVGDALRGALGLVLAAMTGAAGVLIAADVRADIAAARAWQNIHAEAVVIATPAETTPTDRVDVLYAAGPQDQGLRNILLANRFTVPVPSPNSIELLAPERGDARAVTEPAVASSKPELHAVRTISPADGLGERLTTSAAAQRKLGPQLIRSNPRSAGGRNQNYAVRKAPTAKRIVNAGPRWDWPDFVTATTSRVPRSYCAYDEIVLADRNGRHHDPAPSDVTPGPETTVQPCCRGPPRGTFRRHVADATAHLGKTFRETDRSRANPPADLVVIDNLGDRVPVCHAELEVLEAYLDDVLGDVLSSSDTVTKPG